MRTWLFLVLALPTLAACGASDIGDECGSVGDTGVCVENAVCSDRDACPASDPDCGAAGRCRQLCNDDRDCPMTGSCEDVRDSPYKSCIPPR